MKIGFIGLGNMGAAMAKNLSAAGHELAVFNRTRARSEAFAKDVQGSNAGARVRVASTAKGATEGAGVVVSMLADDKAVQASTLGADGILAGLGAGSVHVSSSTISVELSEQLTKEHAAAKRGFVAAPVFGRPSAAAAKQLWVVAAGEPSAIDHCEPVFDAIARGVTRLGPVPSQANVAKLSGNFVIASMIEVVGEAFALTRKAEIPANTFLELFSSVFARSPVFETYAKLIAQGVYEPAGFAATLGLKDMRLVLAAADVLQVPLPVGSIVHDHLLAEVAQGRGERDWAILGEAAARRAGLGETKKPGTRES